MNIYGIEMEEKKHNKLLIIIAIVIACIVIGIVGGILFAKTNNNKEQLAEYQKNEENQNVMENTQSKLEQPNNALLNNNTLQSEQPPETVTPNNTLQTTDKPKENVTTNNEQVKPSEQSNVQQNAQTNGQVNEQTGGGSSSQKNTETNSGETTTTNINITGKLTEKQINAINTIYSSKEKVAYLTFDDGPSNSVTPRILDTLKKENIKATFFVLGNMVKTRHNIVQREKAEGHYIANHGYSHVYSKVYKTDITALEEYEKTNREIQKALGDNNYYSNVFRFPGGSSGGYYDKIKEKTKKNFRKNNVAYLDWNCLTNDAAGAKTKEQIMQNLKTTSKGKNSIVVLMHDAPDKDLTADTLPDVISYLKGQGYSFKNLYDIL